MPRMVKPESPSRPAPDRARLKRAGEVGTLTPGSYRIRSFMSVANMVSISASVMTLIVPGVRDACRSDRVPITTIGSIWVAATCGVSARADAVEWAVAAAVTATVQRRR